MKCFRCDQTFDNLNLLKSDYTHQHNVDQNNHFFRKPFTRCWAFVPRKCLKYDNFCSNG